MHWLNYYLEYVFFFLFLSAQSEVIRTGCIRVGKNMCGSRGGQWVLTPLEKRLVICFLKTSGTDPLEKHSEPY